MYRINVITSSGVDIQFTQSTYTFNEYDGMREICAATVNDTTYDFDVNMVTEVEDAESFSATGDSRTLVCTSKHFLMCEGGKLTEFLLFNSCTIIYHRY